MRAKIGFVAKKALITVGYTLEIKGAYAIRRWVLRIWYTMGRQVQEQGIKR